MRGGVKRQDMLSASVTGIGEMYLGRAPHEGKIKSIPNELPNLLDFKH